MTLFRKTLAWTIIAALAFMVWPVTLVGGFVALVFWALHEVGALGPQSV